MSDPLLDSIENSITNPPDFVDPIAERDDLLMDDLARQLEQVESSIENTPRIAPAPDVFDDNDDPVGSETPAVPEDFGTPEIEEVLDGGTLSSSEQSAAPDSSISSTRSGQLIPKPPLCRSGGSRGRGGHPFRRHGSGRHGSIGARAGHNMRICPENQESIDEQKCQSCEKYRHWPEGTDEELRECWYDWQLKPPSVNSDGDNTAE
jgi:hypothetical protein